MTQTLTDGLPAPPKWAGPLRIGPVELATRFNLAPLAGYTNLPFRLTAREVGGVGLATTDLVNARAILQGSKKTLELLATVPEDRPWAVQLYGSDPQYMTEAARYVESLGATVIDINMGCPVRKVVKTGGGSALMCDPNAAIDLVAKVVAVVGVPVTVKMRLGWDQQNLTSPYFAREFEKVGVRAVTVHGRTRSQGFSGSVDLDGIAATVDAVHSIPVIGNGDVRTVAAAAEMFRRTGCAGIAVGRGALANPWLFRQADRWSRALEPGPAGDYQDRIDFMTCHLRRLIEWRGERFGCVNFRKVATWYTRQLWAGKRVQQRLVLLDTFAAFTEVTDQLRERGEPAGWAERMADGPEIPVPTGPNAHW